MVLAMRRSLAPAQVVERSQAALHNLYRSALLDGRNTVAIYASADSEIATRPLFDRLLGQGMRVALPRVRGRGPEIDFFAVRDWQTLVRSGFGIPEPPADGVLVPVEELDFILVPGIAYDPRGARLGYGMGCYDRALMRARPGTPLVGIGYDFQLVDEVPVEDHDVLLTAIVLERGTLLAAERRSN